VTGIRRIALVGLLAFAAGGATAAAAGPGGASPGQSQTGTTGPTTTTTPTTTAPTAPPATTPLHLHRATLRQDGAALQWSLRTSQTWTPTSLGADGRSLCLRLVYQSGAGFASRDVCVARATGAPRLVSMRVLRSGHHGPSHPLSARVSRPDGRSLLARFDLAALGIPYGSVRWRSLSTTAGCLVGSGGSCFDALPRTGVVLALRAPLPIGCTPAGPVFVTSGSRARRVVALTFDDGPSPYTPRVLSVLERARVHATFFEIGRQVAGYASFPRRALADGDMVGDHTWSHPNVSRGGAFAQGQIVSTADAIQRATGFRPCLFRAPYGAVSSALTGLARRLGFTTIQWDVDPRDWALPGSGAIYANVVGHVRNGSIVLMHDGGGPRGETLAALPSIIQTLRARGYSFVTVDQLTGARLRLP